MMTACRKKNFKHSKTREREDYEGIFIAAPVRLIAREKPAG
jgi:hypothetical protein